MNELKNVKRFGQHCFGAYNQIFSESVAEHTFHMIAMADKLIEFLDLKDLDYRKVIRLITYHDACEYGMKEDFDALIAAKDPQYKKRKEKLERENIKTLSLTHGEFIFELWQEYEEQQTTESKFVRAVDKLQCTIHVLQRGIQFYTPEQQAFEATYAKNSILNFPKLIPFYREVQEEMKRVYTQNNLLWDDSWFLSQDK